MLPERVGFALPFAASFVGLSLIAGSIGASAQQPRRGAAPAAVARPAAPRDRSACRACVPSRSRAAATGHGAASDAATAFRRTFATGGTPLRRAATELPASNCGVTASCHRLAPDSAHRRIAAPKRTARRERAFAAARADRAARASARTADLAAPASHAATRAAGAAEAARYAVAPKCRAPDPD